MEQISSRHEVWKQRRSLMNSQFEDIRRFVRPNIPDFHSNGNQQEGVSRVHHIFDSTAVWANDQLAGGLQGNMFPADERWHEFGLVDRPTTELTHESRQVLQQWADEGYYEFYKPISNFVGATNEGFLDLGAFGTTVVFHGFNDLTNSMFFRAIPLSQVTLQENNEGIIDALDRDWWWTKRQILAEFVKGDFRESDLPREIQDDENTNQKWNIVHSVFPREERDPNLANKFNKPWASIHWIRAGSGPQKKMLGVLREDGFDYFPYLVARWSTLAGEVYGRSPAMNGMPDIKILNLMMKEFLSAVQLNIRPPLVLEDDSIMPPVDFEPAALLYKTPGTDKPELLQTSGNLPLTLEFMDQKREAIVRTFMIDFLLRPMKKERQSIPEIMDVREEMFRQIGPTIARLEREYAMPAIQNTWFELNRRGRLAPATPELAEARIKLIFTSQAAKAQLGVKAANITRFLGDIIPLLQIDPRLARVVDFDELGAAYAEYRNVPLRVIKSPARLAREDEEAADAQQQETEAAQIPQAAKAIKDIAQAEALLAG